MVAVWRLEKQAFCLGGCQFKSLAAAHRHSHECWFRAMKVFNTPQRSAQFIFDLHRFWGMGGGQFFIKANTLFLSLCAAICFPLNDVLSSFEWCLCDVLICLHCHLPARLKELGGWQSLSLLSEQGWLDLTILNFEVWISLQLTSGSKYESPAKETSLKPPFIRIPF